MYIKPNGLRLHMTWKISVYRQQYVFASWTWAGCDHMV